MRASLINTSRRLSLSHWTRVSLLLLGLSLSAGPAWAQTDSQRAAARAAAKAGDQAYKEGRYEDAARYFEKAESIMHAPSLLLHLARSHQKLGHFVKAREAYIKIKREQLPADAPAAFVAAQAAAIEELPEVEKKIARLTIQVVGGPASGLSATVDGEAVPGDVTGIPFPVDPGTHVVEVKADGYSSEPAEVTLVAGGSGEVSLTLSKLPQAAAPPIDPPAPPPEPGADPGTVETPSNGLRLGGYIGVGLGVVGAGLGTYYMVQYFSLDSDGASGHRAWQKCTEDASKDCDLLQEKYQEVDEDAAAKKTYSGISYGIGGAALATGIILLVVSHNSETARNIQPYVTGNSVGVVGRF